MQAADSVDSLAQALIDTLPLIDQEMIITPWLQDGLTKLQNTILWVLNLITINKQQIRQSLANSNIYKDTKGNMELIKQKYKQVLTKQERPTSGRVDDAQNQVPYSDTNSNLTPNPNTQPQPQPQPQPQTQPQPQHNPSITNDEPSYQDFVTECPYPGYKDSTFKASQQAIVHHPNKHQTMREIPIQTGDKSLLTNIKDTLTKYGKFNH